MKKIVIIIKENIDVEALDTDMLNNKREIHLFTFHKVFSGFLV